RSRKRFEERLDLMMRRTPVQQAQVHVRPCSLREPAKEILDQLGVKIAYAPGCKFPLADAMRAAAEVNRHCCERLVHGHQKISRAKNAALGTERAPNSLA